MIFTHFLIILGADLTQYLLIKLPSLGNILTLYLREWMFSSLISPPH